jgi:hypothetical protein
MSDNEQPRITLKAGGGYEAPWVTVPFDNPDEAVEKLNAINNSSLLEKVVETSNLFRAAYTAGPLVAGNTEPAQQAAPQQPKQQGWGQRPAQQGGGQTSKYGGQLHPEGKTCEICPNVLELKKTQTGKAKWQCNDWRWNSGNPNGHTSEFID